MGWKQAFTNEHGRPDQLTDMIFVVNQNHNSRDLQVTNEHDQFNTQAGFNKGVCLEFFHLHGDNPLGWIFRALQYFESHHTPYNKKFLMASYHMEGQAMVWYQEAMDLGQFTSWGIMILVMLICYWPRAYDNLIETLAMLKEKLWWLLIKHSLKLSLID